MGFRLVFACGYAAGLLAAGGAGDDSEEEGDDVPIGSKIPTSKR